MTTYTSKLTAEQLTEARAWIAECLWADMCEEDIAELTDRRVERGIARHFGGGIAGFVATFE